MDGSTPPKENFVVAVVVVHFCSVMSDSFVTPWTCFRFHQPPLSMGFSRQEYWSGLPFPSPGDLPYPGIELTFPELAGKFLITEPPGKPKRKLQFRSDQSLSRVRLFATP